MDRSTPMRFSMAGERKNALRISKGNHSSAARLEAQLMINRAGSPQNSCWIAADFDE